MILIIYFVDLALVTFFSRACTSFVSFRQHAHRATTVLVLTLGSGVDGFTLDPDTGRFLHTHKDIRIPAAGPIYSFNEAHFHDYDEPVRRYLEALKSGSSSVGVRYVLFFSFRDFGGWWFGRHILIQFLACLIQIECTLRRCVSGGRS